ncbi:myosin B [Babesia divergens]|uniref:Myosin B n=1 Tax=Babesia divergens TaxID=32595 RepID=A0AAD9GDB8_BABDI|nr:myosin B [Babesia divergens]
MAPSDMAAVVAKAKPGGKPKAKGDHFKRSESRVDNLDYLVGSQVWIKVDSDELFELVTVNSFSGDRVTVSYNGDMLTVPFEDCLNVDVMNVPFETHDLVKLPHANSAVVLDILRKRFMSDCIYTYAGKLLIVLNPFKLIPDLYGPQSIERYRRADTSIGFPADVPPHTYAVAQCAINGLLRDNHCQSCIVTGESGAGKTETAKQLMSFFAHGASQSHNKVQDIIMGSNVILEAFGNAKTLRNNNSSRFGKFIKILVAAEGGLKGGIICSYMLELSRIEFQSEGERNYHIFYQCLKGLSQPERDAYGFHTVDFYKFLNRWKCYDAPGIDDLKDFGEVKRELQQLFSDEEYSDFMRCIAGILLCGNIEFKEVAARGVENAASVSNTADFQQLAALLGFQTEEAEEALTTKVVTIQGENIMSAITVSAAEVNVRALAKDLYGSLFEFCIEKINSIITFDDENARWIGILDIYGFEYFQRNTYEQLLINYANERLQQYFINRVFASEIAEYDEEGIDHSSIKYTDNSQVLEIFDKPNCSIFSFLEEQCLIQTGSAESFTASCKAKIKNELFIPAQGSVCRFTVVHTATSVMYDTDEFVAKNKHKLSPPIVRILHGSANSIVKQCAKRIPEDMGNMKGKFMGSKFHSSIGALMKTLHMTESHFIRCIKTNQQKKPRLYETRNVYGQLISLSIVEAIQTIHRGYAYRATFEKFIKDNEFLSSCIATGSTADTDLRNSIQAILQNLCIPAGDYQVGKKKVFLKKNGWMLLEKVFLQYARASKPLSDAIYSIYRVWRNRRHLLNSREMIIRIQSNIRRFRVQETSLIAKGNLRNFIGLVLTLDLILNEDPRVSAAVTIQSWCRMYICRKAYMQRLADIRAFERKQKAIVNLKRVATARHVIAACNFLRYLHASRARDRAVTKIASCWRMHAAIRRANNLRLQKIITFAATFIQKHVRGYLQRRRYQYTLNMLPYVIRLQAVFRSRLAVKRLEPSLRIRVSEIRERLRRLQLVTFIQSMIRCVIAYQRVTAAYCAVLSFQKFGWPRSCHEDITRVRAATATIKGFLKKMNQQSALRTEKNRILQGADQRVCERLTCDETEAAHRIFERFKIAQSSCLLPIHFNVYADHRGDYPDGWCSALERFLCSRSTGRGISGVSMGNGYSVFVVDGTQVYGFGRQPSDHRQEALAPRAPQLITTISNNLRVSTVLCGNEHTVILLSDHSVYSWGNNSYGQCGILRSNSNVKEPTLVQIYDSKGKPLQVKSLGVGSYHNCVVGVNGDVMVWGKWRDINLPAFGENIYYPVPICASVLPKDDTIVEAYCGNKVSYLLTKRGRLLSFGSCHNGQLGRDGNRNAPIEKIGIPNQVTSVSCGRNFTLVISERSDIYIFGTALAVRGGNKIKQTFMTPQRLECNRVAVRSPVVKCSVGTWEANILTEDLLVWAWTCLLVEEGCIRPIVYRYTCLSDSSIRNVYTIAAAQMTATFVGF